MGHANRLRVLCEQGTLGREDILKSCEKLEKTALRISKIVKGLRVYSRDVENEELAEILVNDLIEDTLSFCTEKFRSHGVECSVEIDPLDAAIICRPIQISQVLLNLLNNAFDAVRGEESKWIKIKFNRFEDSSHICVIDSGPGIPDEIKDKIIEPFFTTKPVGVGTGLGLSICTGIVSAHGGVLSLVEGAEHTTFCVALPSEDTIS
jgi:C4-dicarboxylate-specific signal transduction histidine kinase